MKPMALAVGVQTFDFGDDVVDHYAHHFTMECDAFDAAVTDWEHRRYFERI